MNRIVNDILMIFGGLIIFVVIAVIAYPGFFGITLPISNHPVACTTEAKICPDGSSVGRTGPNCDFTECPTPTAITLGAFTTAHLNQPLTFQDGLMVTLTKVEDSRCKPNVVCIWAGELTDTFTISGGKVGAVPQILTLGTSTVSRSEVTQAGYTFTLDDGTIDSANIMVSVQNIVGAGQECGQSGVDPAMCQSGYHCTSNGDTSGICVVNP